MQIQGTMKNLPLATGIFAFLLLFVPFPQISAYNNQKGLCVPDSIANYDIYNIVDSVIFGHDTLSNRTIDIIVVHTNYYVSKDIFNTKGCIEQFKKYDVAPHYLITRNAQILCMVKEEDVAWHAGKSKLPNTDRINLNKSSIGIEIISHPDFPPTKEQVDALKFLVNDIRLTHIAGASSPKC